MPKDKDLKRVVRSRMQKTGESYTAARSQVVNKALVNKSPKSPDFAATAGMSDDAVKSKTGRTWAQWVRDLDRVKAANLTHREIASIVHNDFEASAWWAQTVTVAYERIRGLRDIGQRRGGLYDANKSKTFPVPVAQLYRAFRDVRLREKWLGDEKLTVRKATPNKSIRIRWGDDTPVDVYFTEKGASKSQVAIQHRNLASKAQVAKVKEFWGERLKALGLEHLA